MSYKYEEAAEYDTTLEYETSAPYTESTGDNAQESTPFNTMELETVQNATIGSGAVQYSTSQPASTDADESTEELCRDFIHGNCERVNCRYKHDITEREKTTQVQPSNTSQEVCRDFMHGHCNRAGCRFKHDSTERDSDRVNQPICKDYQKSGCHRTKCRYLHLSETEEAEFSKTGKLPTVSNAPAAASEKPELCRDFTNGNCNRGASCRYSHGDNNNTTLSLLFGAGKRPFSSLSNLVPTGGGGNDIGMKDENEQLKTKLLDLRKQVMELTQLNDALYSENMKFRKELGGGAADVGKMALLPSPIFSK